jgi:S-adenosylmethionine:tRNA ribosyltransferase-isomerase
MRLNELDYRLPIERIAQYPLAQRDESRLLVLERQSGRWEDRHFKEFPNLLRGDEVLVLNNTRVIPARLFGWRAGVGSQPAARTTRRQHLTATIEVLLTRQVGPREWEALVHPGRKVRTRERIRFDTGELEAQVIGRGEYGLRTLRFEGSQDVLSAIERIGHVPLPPYIERQDEPGDRERYQTVFASVPGAVAAPTAGLHFTPEILERIRACGVEVCELTLHVGPGTFQPIRSATIEEHKMHAETYLIPADTAKRIEAAHAAGRTILAGGTTVVRALEDSAAKAAGGAPERLLVSGRNEATIFITPGFHFRVVDALLTNFHLPRSSLLALVCAFGGRENVLAAYGHAVDSGYRFYSYGDCMLIR